MDRRAALKLLGSILALSSVKANAAEAKKPRWKTGIGLNGFQSLSVKYKKTIPIWEVLDFASRTGFDGVELVPNWPMGGYPKLNETGRIAALLRTLREGGFAGWIMIDAWQIPDPYGACRKGKQAIDRAMAS